MVLDPTLDTATQMGGAAISIQSMGDWIEERLLAQTGRRLSWPEVASENGGGMSAPIQFGFSSSGSGCSEDVPIRFRGVGSDGSPTIAHCTLAAFWGFIDHLRSSNHDNQYISSADLAALRSVFGVPAMPKFREPGKVERVPPWFTVLAKTFVVEVEPDGDNGLRISDIVSLEAVTSSTARYEQLIL